MPSNRHDLQHASWDSMWTIRLRMPLVGATQPGCLDRNESGFSNDFRSGGQVTMPIACRSKSHPRGYPKEILPKRLEHVTG